MFARGNLRGGGDRQTRTADRIVVNLPAANRHGKRAGVIEFRPLAAAERIGHELVDHHCGALRTGGDVAEQGDPDQGQGGDAEEWAHGCLLRRG